MQQQITVSEVELMKIIWDNGGTALYAYIMEELEKKENAWKKNTVLTLLSRLVEKDFLTTNKIGRRNEYVALISEQDYLTAQTRGFVESVYDGNVRGLVTTLIQQEILSADDLDVLQKFWREKLND